MSSKNNFYRMGASLPEPRNRAPISMFKMTGYLTSKQPKPKLVLSTVQCHDIIACLALF